MFIDYISLMLINLAAGLALLASYVYWGLGSSNQRRWIPGFGVVGAIALVTGLHMTFTWPVPGSFNIAYGETTILFGILFIGTSLALALGWELLILGIYGFFAGLVSLLIGFRIELFRIPPMTGIGGVIQSFLLFRLNESVGYRNIGFKFAIAISEEPLTARIPSLMIIGKELKAWMNTLGMEPCCIQLDVPPPDLVIDIISFEPDEYRDYEQKPAEYALRKVPQYWIVDARAQQMKITVFTLEASVYRKTEYCGSQTICSPALPNLELVAEEVLSGGMD